MHFLDSQCLDLLLLTLIDLTAHPTVKVNMSTFPLIPDVPDKKNDGQNCGFSEEDIWLTAVQSLTRCDLLPTLFGHLAPNIH